MVPCLQIENWTCQVSQGHNLFLNFIEFVGHINSFSDRITHLFERVHLSSEIQIMMFSFNFIKGMAQVSQISHSSFNVTKISMLSVDPIIYGSLKILQSFNLLFNFIKLVTVVLRINRSSQSFQFKHHLLNLIEFVDMVNVIDRSP